ncbi:S8 family serine peptidase, partial [Beijerinckia sp. L45]|uniref:S8 family peptidase n=1 Tax=Beijerinckia sp. L45 TaxID=1641855 RepID=UPI001AEF2AD5
ARVPTGGGGRGGGFGGGSGLGLGLGGAILGGVARPPPQQVYDRDVGPAPARRLKRKPIVRTAVIPPRHTPPPVPALRPPARPGFGVPASDERRYVPDEVLLTLKAPVSPEQVRRLEVDYGLTPLARTRVALLDASVSRYRLREGTSVSQAIRALRSSPSFVAAAQPNFLFALQDDSQAPIKDASRMDAISSTTSPDRPVQYAVETLKLVAAHRVATGAHVLIAIIDTGLDETHPEISGMVADRFDAVGGRFAAQAHGTAMAGVIVAHQMLVGIAPDAHVIAVRAFSSLSGGGTGGTGYDILRGLDFAALHGAQIVNMSFAGPEDPLLRDALSAARARGIVAIAAAGNAGPGSKPLYPAAEPGVIAVTATDASNTLFAMANRGAYVALAAPGVDILAPGLGGGMQMTSGTSIATAEASGVAALLIEGNTVSPDTIRKLLCDTARHLPDLASAAGAGLIDADAAVSARDRLAAPVNRRP